jgi:tRNA nucleotidyltransferase (CCA-adding enzyme)
VNKFKPGDAVQFTDEALQVPEEKWSSFGRTGFVLPDERVYVVAVVDSLDIVLNNGNKWSDRYFDLVREDDFSNVEMFLVGGAVRDRLMGLMEKDLDFTVEAHSFEQMQAYLIHEWGVETYVQQPEYGTIRGHFGAYRDENGVVRSRYFAGLTLGKLAGDFVLSRKEGYYTDGRHPDDTMPGTLYDDLARRDFTVNAIALDKNGEYIDPFHGRDHILSKNLVAVGNAKDRFLEDALRAIRALRFSITKGFTIHKDVWFALDDPEVQDALKNNISTERIREELNKCFQFDTLATMDLLSEYPELRAVIFFDHGIWLEPTVKNRRFDARKPL